jgi:DEAD/DEAH box helicase domain-containing protein
MQIFEVIFDCETKKFFDAIEDFDPSKLGVSLLSMYFREVDENLKEIKGEIKSFWEKDLGSAWEIFNKADRIIGFNSINFDVPALSPYSPPTFSKLPHFDILAHVKESQGRRVSLDALAKATLGTGKTDSGANAIKYFEKGDKESLEKLKKYCEADVMLTRNLYDFGIKNGHLKFIDFWNETHDVKVDFSYPKTEPTAQKSLF